MNAPGRKSAKPALLMMVRLPQPGRVKTRLAATLGPTLATQFYRLCAAAVLRETESLSTEIDRYVIYSGRADPTPFQKWLGPGLRYLPQANGDLGRRLRHAFQAAFAAGTGRAVIIATDTPDLTAALLRQAFALLETRDTVLGPAEDGGYYLLGMNADHPTLFNGIDWSTGRVLAQTQERIHAAGLTNTLLPVLPDIDTEADLRRWAQAPHRKPPELTAFLAALPDK